MKTLNVRLIGGLAAALVTLGTSAYFLHGYQTSRNAGAYLREGRRAKEEGRPQEALRHLSRYVKLAPHDAEGLAEYALQLKDLGNEQPAYLQPAYLALGQAVRRAPGRDEFRRQLVELEIALGRYAEAKWNLEGTESVAETESVEKEPAVETGSEEPKPPTNAHALLKKFPRDGGLWIQLGFCNAELAKTERAEEYGEAVAAFEKAIAVSPERLESYLLLAKLLARFEDRVGAERSLERMVENNPKDHRAYVARGRWRLAPQDGARAPSSTDEPSGGPAAQAWADARRALELAPKEPEALFFAGDAAVANGQLEEARGIALRALDLGPANPRVYSLLADVETAGGDRAAAAAWLGRGVSAVPEDTDLRWNWAHLLIELGRVSESAPQIEKLRRAGHAAAAVSYLEARTAVAEARWPEAIRRLEKIRPELAGWPDLQKQADLWSGRCHQELGDIDRQLAAFRRAAEIDPSWVPARLGIADVLLASGRLDEAEAEYERVASMKGVRSAAPLKLAQVQLAANLRRAPDQREPNWTKLTKLLDEIERSQPGTPQVVLLRAEMLVSQQKIGDAERLLADARAKDPSRLELRAAEVALAQRAADWPRVERLLEDAEAHVDDAVGLRLLEARSLALRSKDQGAAEIRKLWETSSGGLPPEETVRLADGLSNIALALGDNALAYKLGSVVAADRLNDLRVRLLLLDAALRGGGPVDPILADLKRIEGEIEGKAGPLWNYAEALRLTAAAKDGASDSPEKADSLEKAETHLAAAKAARPRWSRLPLASAEIARLRGNGDRAADAYLEAISLGERRSEVVGRAVTLLLEQQRVAEADQVIRGLQAQQTAFTSDLDRLAAETSLRHAATSPRPEDFDRALGLAESVAAGSDRYEDHLWFGQALAAGSRTEEAERELRRAIELAGGAPEPWISLVHVLARAGRTQDAEKAVAEAREAVADDRAPVTVAQCYEILGRTEAADEGYRDAMARSPDDATVARRAGEFFLRNKKTSEAETVLRGIVAGKPEGSEDDLRWARRNLALVAAARGGPGYAEAMNLLQANSAAAGATASARADKRATAMVLAMQPFAGPRRQAIATLADLLADDRTSSAEDRFVLAELYRREGDFAKAAEEMLKVLKAEPEQPRYVAAYVRILLDQKGASDPDPWIDRLKSLAPNELSTTELEARALFAGGRDVKLVELFKGFAASAPADGGTSPDRRLWAAEKLEAFADESRRSGRTEPAEKLTAEAESLFAEHARRNPTDGLLFAAFLARQNQLSRALDLLPAKIDAAGVRHVPVFVAGAVTSAGAKPEDLKRVQTFLEASLESEAESLVLQLAVADLCSWRGDYVAAEKMYRQVLQENGRHVAAMNNLAIVVGMGLGRQEEALRLVESAIEATGPAGALLDTRGLIHLSAGRVLDARRDFEQAIAEEPTPDRHLHLSMALSRLGDAKAAKTALDDARQLGLSESRLHPLERSAMRESLLVKR